MQKMMSGSIELHNPRHPNTPDEVLWGWFFGVYYLPSQKVLDASGNVFLSCEKPNA